MTTASQPCARCRHRGRISPCSCATKMRRHFYAVTIHAHTLAVQPFAFRTRAEREQWVNRQVDSPLTRRRIAAGDLTKEQREIAQHDCEERTTNNAGQLAL